MVNAQVLQGQWNQVRGELKKKWGQLTEDDLRFTNGIGLGRKPQEQQDNPRRLGKDRDRLVGPVPRNPKRKLRRTRQHSPVPLAVFAHRQ
jgi:hypothetical protein